MLLNKYKDYGLERNPFPAQVYGESNIYDDDVVSTELTEFREKLVVGALTEKRPMSFLWSLGDYGSDTGFGKTALLRRVEREINADWGMTTLMKADVEESVAADHPACAVYGCFKAHEVTNFYAGLFSAVLDAADVTATDDETETSLMWRLRERVLKSSDIKPDEQSANVRTSIIRDALNAARRPYGIGQRVFREDMINLLGKAEDAQGFADALELMVTPTSRVRNGLYYFVTFAALARAAGMVGVFVFLDQLEDLANPYLSTKAKRHREVERFRDDIFEDSFLSDNISCVMTFHRRAEEALTEAWVAARLPNFSPELRSNASKIVLMRGLTTDDKAGALIKAYLNAARTSGEEDSLSPFTSDAVARLREKTSGRVGEFLVRAREVLETAAGEKAAAPLDAAYVDAVTTASLGDEGSGSAYSSLAVSREKAVGDAFLG